MEISQFDTDFLVQSFLWSRHMQVLLLILLVLLLILKLIFYTYYAYIAVFNCLQNLIVFTLVFIVLLLYYFYGESQIKAINQSNKSYQSMQFSPHLPIYVKQKPIKAHMMNRHTSTMMLFKVLLKHTKSKWRSSGQTQNPIEHQSRNNFKYFVKIESKCAQYKNSFSKKKDIVDWNALDNSIALDPNEDSFKSKLKRHLFE